ncbi:MAG: bifunctional aspartate kinase/homoserine dehydrogenase I, partial [Flavobacteriales bacterium]|nr:bifunctional aspartate kinase/homoserine dehydrogenase I [Flavobacteriales bacterium]
KVLKFGRKSLREGVALNNVLAIIESEAKQGAIAVVVSAIDDATDRLIELFNKAIKGDNYSIILEEKKKLYQSSPDNNELNQLLKELENLLEQLSKKGDKSGITLNDIMAFGELCSVSFISSLLIKRQINAKPIDARKFLKVDKIGNSTLVNYPQSTMFCKLYFEHFDFKTVPVITGFIASDELNQTHTLGRNGSNYSASLIANFLEAEELQNWTTVDGIFTAKPELVPDARLIKKMSFQEAHELANFGVNVLHPKTIEPLMEKGIPLRIVNTLNKEGEGTLISNNGGESGIKAVSALQDIVLITIEGRGLLGKVGIDARIFKVLSDQGIGVRLISQASSERGIGFVVDCENGELAVKLLQREFVLELERKSISSIHLNRKMAIIAIVGKHNYVLEKAISGLRRNKIFMHLISNSISGNHISLVIDSNYLNKGLNIVHSQVFGVIKTVNVFCLGKGVVGSTLIDQILETNEKVVVDRKLRINVVGVADSKQFIFNPSGVNLNWKKDLQGSSQKNSLKTIIQKLKDSYLENIVVADNTASQDVSDNYLQFLNAGFDIVAANKKLNSGNYTRYKEVQNVIRQRGSLFYYETNVGAGLPIIDTLKHLKESADTITKIRGVFSGSLSYLFNTFSISGRSFAEILLEAKEKGLTEPDPREDLSGLDVARKLIILSREIGLKVELEEVEVENLIPQELIGKASFDSFIAEEHQLNRHYEAIKNKLPEGKVLRYVGDLDVAQQKLKVSLIETDQNSSLGNIKGADSIFEVYTQAYGEQPIVIQGAGAGGEVTARGVYSDLIRMGRKY